MSELENKELNLNELDDVSGGSHSDQKWKEHHRDQLHYCYNSSCSKFNEYQDGNRGKCKGCGQWLNEFKFNC